jgi:glyoxylase-like metal-dependent hydrolase (beta-lactamase superfamily II)
MIDLNQYGMNKVCSTFLLHWNNSTVIFDVGTSDDIRKVISYLKKRNIPRESVKFLVPSHHHFDHAGGMWKILDKLKKYNLDIKILTTSFIKEKMQHPEKPMKAAASTYADWVGKMKFIENSNFQIVEPDTRILLDEKRNLALELVSSPGHTHDHVCPTIFINDKPYFSYFGEAAGTLFNNNELKTLPTSMPTEFTYETYMKSVKKLKNLHAENIGFCHFGAVTGLSDVETITNDQIEFLPIFRDFVKKKYEEFQSTRPVVEATIKELFYERSSFHRAGDLSKVVQGISTRNALALVYGMLVDLGFKKNKY